jgi:hypothetical protein
VGERTADERERERERERDAIISGITEKHNLRKLASSSLFFSVIFTAHT